MLPAAPDPPYFGLDPTPPSGLVQSAYYDASISLTAIDFEIAAGVPRADVDQQLAQVKRTTPALRAALLRGSSIGAARDPSALLAKIAPRGLRVVYTYIAAADGVIGNYPGTTGGYPEGYDHRTMGWYTVAVDEPGPVWNMLEADELGMGLLLTVSQGLYDDDGGFLGVAGLDVGFAYLIDELLDPDELDGVAEAFLLGPDNVVIVRSSHKASARTARTFVPAAFLHADRLPETTGKPGGWVEFDDAGSELLLRWNRLHAVDWTYVLVGQKAPLFEVAATL